MTGEITAAIADFVVAVSIDDVPAGVIESAKSHILDTVGLALAGSVSDASRISRRHLAEQGFGETGSAIFGTDRRAPPRFAAFANAVSAHADNFDDTTPQIRADRTGGIHASGAALPAVLALAEQSDATGTEVLVAYLTGVEISSRLNHAIAARHYADGFHTTGTLNVFGAAAAAARLGRLNREQTVNAIALAASQAGGVRRNFGTMAEILHSGWAAENGIVAAGLAAGGMTGAEDALDGPTGFFAAAAAGYDAGEIIGKLGSPWVFEDPGVWIKPHPNGALTHPGAGCLLSLLAEHAVASDKIERIVVRTNERVWKTLQHHNPTDGMQAKFSMEFTLGIIALDRRAGLGEFTTGNLRRADVQEMMRRIDYSAFDRPEPDYTNVTTLIEIVLSDGNRYSGRVDFAPGSTRAPMRFNDVCEKFRQCAAFGGHSDEDADRVVDEVAKIDRAGSIDGIVNALISKE